MKAEIEKEEWFEFVSHFAEAVADCINYVRGYVSGSEYVPKHYNFPRLSSSSSPFPSVSQYYEGGPIDYSAIIYRSGLGGLFAFQEQLAEKIESVAKLLRFIESHPNLKDYFASPLPSSTGEQVFATWMVYTMLGSAVDRYCHTHGLEYDKKKSFYNLWPIVKSVRPAMLDIALVVPIALTKFDFSRIKLGDGKYIVRIPDPYQLARADQIYHGSGVPQNLVSAATHAFVSTGWQLPNDTNYDARQALGNTRAFDTTEIDKFFAALRAATGRETGYAQILYLPRKWTFDYKATLPSVYGGTIRRYPSAFDDFGWTRDVSPISLDEAKEVARLYNKILVRTENKITLALKRLNSCLIRDNVADAILDATIGLEVLLGDNETDSIGYKLRMRAAALTMVDPHKRKTATEIKETMVKVYDKRSAIVHGSKRGSRKAKKAEPSTDEQVKQQAIDLLRYILDVMVEKPEYLKDGALDALMLGDPA
jgi:hypothetical protein